MKILVVFGLALTVGLAGTQIVQTADRACTEINAEITAARKAGNLDQLAALWLRAKANEEGCSEEALYCLGQSIALGHVEAAYTKGDAGASTGEIEPLLDKGLAYGSPWQLRTARGDLLLARAKVAHDGSLYSKAALDYQEALIALGEPSICGAYGEAPRPPKDDIASIYRRMSTALLLARPVKIATTRCAPCEWLFINGVAGFDPAVRPLPITFPSNASEPTPEGRAAALALLECVKAGGYSRIVLTGHTDQLGSATYNLALSARRLDALKRILVDGGFAGQIALEPKGKSEPFITDGQGYLPSEVRRLNRRVELKDATPGAGEKCG